MDDMGDTNVMSRIVSRQAAEPRGLLAEAGTGVVGVDVSEIMTRLTD
jgi:hypothetical protein